MRSFILSVFLATAAQLCAGGLEQLFEKGPAEAFLAQAKPLAAAGDAEALFLLGKAYHLGKGVEVDLDEASRLYTTAAEKDHARALHNLGLIKLDRNQDVHGARTCLERALALGLRTPTLFNLGRAYDRENVMVFDDPRDFETASRYYFQAYETTGDLEALDRAVRASVLAVRMPGNRTDPAGRDARRREAIRLGLIGAEKNRPRSLQNLGALHYYEGDFTAALPWIQRAADLGQPTALYTLGEMHAKGQGLPQDREAALAWYERAATLNHPEATRLVAEHWRSVTELEHDPAALAEAIDRLVAIHEGPLGNDLFLDLAIQDARERLIVLTEIDGNAAHPPSLPPGLPQLHLCVLDVPEAEGGIPLRDEEWTIRSLRREPEGIVESRELAQGRTDAQGCVRLGTTEAARLRNELEQGRTLVFSCAMYRRLLEPRRTERGDLLLIPGPNVHYLIGR